MPSAGAGAGEAWPNGPPPGWSMDDWATGWRRPGPPRQARPEAEQRAEIATDRTPAPERRTAPGSTRLDPAGSSRTARTTTTTRPRRRTEPTPLHIDRDELERAGGPGRGERLARKLREAARAYEDDRLDDAHRRLRSLLSEAPGYAPARELAGLTAYHQGRWSDALRELEAFAELTGSTEQHPVMADCHRALRHWEEVERLWTELRDASPSAELVTEGRIVAAGALADQDQVPRAIELLARSFAPPQRPRPFHLRRMYALADLYEQVGELPRARDLFRRVAAADPGVLRRHRPGPQPRLSAPAARADRSRGREGPERRPLRSALMFRALVLEEGEGAPPIATIRQVDEAELPEGDVDVDVEYSTVNYKDGLAVTGKRRSCARSRWCPASTWPARSRPAATPTSEPGDRVVLNGLGVGESHWGGYATKARAQGRVAGHAARRASRPRRPWPSAPPATRPCCACWRSSATASTPERGDVLVTGRRRRRRLGGGRAAGRPRLPGGGLHRPSRRGRLPAASSARPTSSTGPSWPAPGQAAAEGALGGRRSTPSAATRWPTSWPQPATAARSPPAAWPRAPTCRPA